MKLFALLASLVLLVTSLSFADGSYTGTSKFDTAIINSLITGDIRGFYRVWELSTADDSVTLDVNGYLEIAADSGTVLTGPLEIPTASISTFDVTATFEEGVTFEDSLIAEGGAWIDWMSLLGNGLFWGVMTFDSTVNFDGAVDFDSTANFDGQVSGVYADIDSLYCDILGTILVGADSVVINHDLFVGGLTGLCQFYDDVIMDSTLQVGYVSSESLYTRGAEINETLNVDSINVVGLVATGTVDLGGLTDTLVIGADSFSVVNGVITTKF